MLSISMATKDARRILYDKLTQLNVSVTMIMPALLEFRDKGVPNDRSLQVETRRVAAEPYPKRGLGCSKADGREGRKWGKGCKGEARRRGPNIYF